jgi:hypothetical protein
MGFVLDKVALGKVFFEYSVFPCKFSFRRLLHTHHPGLVAGVPSGFTPPHRLNLSDTILFSSYS